MRIHVQSAGSADLSAGFLTREITSGVFLLTNGNYQTLFMTTGDGVLLVDAPEPLVDFVLPAIADVTDEKLTTILYSHAHTDHIGGAQHLVGPGVTVIAEQGVADFLRDRNDGIRVLPTQTFSDAASMTFGTRRLELKKDRFHSPEGDLVVFLPEEKIVMAVDILAPGWVPLLDFDITGDMFSYLGAFDRLLAYDFAHFVSGHTADVAGRRDVEVTKEYTFDVYETVKRIHGEIDVAELLARNRDNEQAGIRALIEEVTSRAYYEISSRWAGGPMQGIDVWSESHCRAMVLYIRWSD